jgi:hypothetical protein
MPASARTRESYRRARGAIAFGLGLAVLLAAMPAAAASNAETLAVSVRPEPVGVAMAISARVPFRFTLRQLQAPDRLVVDLAGLDGVAPGGTQEVNLPPVRAIRLARGSGFTQVVVDLMEPVFADVAVGADSRILTLCLVGTGSGAGRGPTAPALPTEVVRLQYVKPREVAAHLQTLLPGLTARPDETIGGVLLTGPPDLVAQAKQIVAALDVPPGHAPSTDVVPLKAAKADTLAPVLAAIFPQAQIRGEPRLNAIVLTAPQAVVARVKAVIAALDVPAATPAGPTTEVVQVRHIDPTRLASLVAGALPQAQIRVDPATRTLAITAAPPVLAQAKTLVQQLDVPSPTDPVSEVVRVRGDPEALARAVSQALPAVISTPERGVNAVILRGPRAEVERAKAMLASLEAQPGPSFGADAGRGDSAEVHDAERVRHRAGYEPVG